jgi:hypothetical protein
MVVPINGIDGRIMGSGVLCARGFRFFFGNSLVWPADGFCKLGDLIGRFEYLLNNFIENSSVFSWFDYGVNACDEGVSTGLTRMGDFQTICQWFKLMV